MKLAILSVFLCASYACGFSIRTDGILATDCSPEVCLVTDGCHCSITSSPIATDETPQFVLLTFDDAVTDIITSTYHEPLLYGRTNADGSPISATFYVPHEYTDYERVNQLYNEGFEIAVHSISKNGLSTYWQAASTEVLLQEFGGQRTIVSTFANIPLADVRGARTPNLELAGNRTFRAYREAGLEFDSSWPTFSTVPIFPYSLNFLSNQSCVIGTCPNEAFPGQWVLPIVDLVGVNGIECNTLQACGIAGNSTEIFDWLLTQFNRVYNGNRSPITLAISSAFYQISGGGFDGLIQFLDYLQERSDVFLVSSSQVIEWMQDPIPAGQYSPSINRVAATCEAITCPVPKDLETRYMRSCVECPAVYPWLGNPLGEVLESEEEGEDGGEDGGEDEEEQED